MRMITTCSPFLDEAQRGGIVACLRTHSMWSPAPTLTCNSQSPWESDGQTAERDLPTKVPAPERVLRMYVLQDS